MNFFQRQEIARKQSRRMVVLFALAVLAIVLAVDAAVLLGLGFVDERAMDSGDPLGLLRDNAGLLLLSTLLTLGIVAVASLVRMNELRAGGGVVARKLGGVPVPEDTRDLQLRRLRNVVEEIAIASGVPVPEIYILEQETGINAFAAGYTPADAAVAVTRGALERLNRDELQGVIAHEFSHVLNGDMRLNIRLMGVLFGILVLGIIGRKVLYHSRGARDSKGAPILMVALVVMLVGYVGVFFGRLIKAGVSRSREYLADASAVQFTRQTTGIAGALKKIAGISEGSKLASAETEEVSHMLFGDGIGYSALFATHPPLLKRIQVLDPTFRADELKQLSARWHTHPPDGLAEDRVMGLAAGEEAARAELPRSGSEVAVSAAAIADHVGEPQAEDYRQADSLAAALPPLLRAAAESRSDAAALLFALLLDEDASVRARQLEILQARFDAKLAGRSEALATSVAQLAPQLRLPLAQLAFPSLRRRPRAELEQLREALALLIHADGRVHVFEYCLGRLVSSQLGDALDPSRARPSGGRRLKDVQREAVELLAVLAQVGHADAATARRAFAAGMQHLMPDAAERYATSVDWVDALDRSLAVLDQLQPAGKQLLVEAMVTAISHDGRVTIAEGELLRTVCGVLHCPMPPLLGRT